MAILSDENTLTVAEVAVAAEVSHRYVGQVIEEQVMPDELYMASGKRRFLPSAAAFVALNRRASGILTREARHDAFVKLLSRHHDQFVDPKGWRRWSLFLRNEIVELDMVLLQVSSIFEKVAKRLDEMQEASATIVSNPEILSGTPVIAGTRVPAYDIAASVEAQVPLDRLCKGFGISERQIGLAYIWAKANPPMGRPKRALAPPPADAVVKRVPRRRQVG
jgi:uncharacterized protein (DUF433 family)